MFETPAFSAGLNDVAMMREAVEQSGCHFGVTEHGWPFGKCEICCDDGRCALIELADQVEQELAIRLDRLHLTLQAAMGWTNSHLYMFEAASATWGVSDPDFGGDDLPANKSTLWDVIEDIGKKTINYIYDFGDNWEHTIKIGRITDPVPVSSIPD